MSTSGDNSLTIMEGTLCKWTNYWNGWQPRWFILDQGVLTYYKSREEVNQGCKGSVKISACEIVPHPLDCKRLDIIIPSEQHYHLRANSETERQKWLVVLGSAKQAAFSSQTSPTAQSPTPLEVNVKVKKSKLRLYCDLLMQQVHAIKNSEDPSEREETAEMLDSTCDMFIRCLDECMKAAETRYEDEEGKEFRPPTLSPTNQNTVTGMVGGLDKQKISQIVSSKTKKRESFESNSGTPIRLPEADSAQVTCSIHRKAVIVDSDENEHDEVFSDMNSDIDMLNVMNNNNEETQTQVQQSRENYPKTFFSEMKHSFAKLEFLQDNQIPMEEFLGCCESILPVFDVLGSTAFAPVKMDIQGNINKLDRHRLETKCISLQSLVQRELDSKTISAKNSGTDALLWLKRALAFICTFLNEACQPGEIDLAHCATKAYGETLRKHHNFVVKGVFSVALRALPYYSTFLEKLAPSALEASKPDYEAQLKKDGLEYTKQLQKIVTAIDTFYVRNDIVSPQNL